MEQTIEKYSKEVETLNKEKKQIIRDAKQEAENLLKSRMPE